MTQITAILLAAGQGTRFDPSGRRWKLLEPLADGRSIVRTSCELIAPQVDELVVVCSSEHRAALELELQGLPLQLLTCAAAPRGMGASLKCGVQSSRPAVGWLFALADMPFVAPDTLRLVIEHLRNGASIVRPSFEGRPGHPVGFAASLRDALLAIDDASGASQLWRSAGSALTVVPVDDPGCVRDVDTPGDLPGASS